MTQEDKNLLLIDLCARLPYGVMCACGKYNGQLKLVCPEGDYCVLQNSPYAIETIKPYLRPMSSMTEEERKEYNDIVKNTIDFYDCPKSEEICFFIIPIEWLNKHYFDFRSLIEKGLALEAPDGIYNLKEK